MPPRLLFARALRRTPIRFAVLLVAYLLAPILAAAPAEPFPARPAGRVLDTTGTLSPTEAAALDARAQAAGQRTGGEIAVAVIDTTGGLPSHDYALRLANQWRIGEGGGRRGVLILLAKRDRRAEIALSAGLESPERALAAKEILERGMAPRFRQGDYAGGLMAAIEGAAGRILQGGDGASPGAAPAEVHPSPPPTEPRDRATPGDTPRTGKSRTVWALAGSFVVVVVLLLVLLQRNRRRKPNHRRGLEGRVGPRRPPGAT